MNELLSAYKSATGTSEWNVTHQDVDEGIKKAKEAMASNDFMTKMMAIGSLGLIVSLKKGLGGDFVAAGVSDNELLGLPREDVAATVNKILNG
jgi:hypothetical protein